MNSIGGVEGVGAPLPPNRVGGDGFIRFIGDRLILTFSEGAGTTVRDLSGNGNDGTLTGATHLPTWERNKIDFDGTDDYIDCGDINAVDAATVLTVESQVTPDVWTNDRLVIEKGNVFALGRLSVISLTAGLAVRDTTSAWTLANLPAFLSTDLSQHFLGVYDGAKNNIYLDTVRTEGAAVTGALFSSAYVVNIGGRGDNFQYDGSISFVRINITAFSQSQVLAEYLWNKWRN